MFHQKITKNLFKLLKTRWRDDSHRGHAPPEFEVLTMFLTHYPVWSVRATSHQVHESRITFPFYLSLKLDKRKRKTFPQIFFQSKIPLNVTILFLICIFCFHLYSYLESSKNRAAFLSNSSFLRNGPKTSPKHRFFKKKSVFREYILWSYRIDQKTM